MSDKRRVRAGAIVGGVLLLWALLAWVGGPVPKRCGRGVCAPWSRCVHTYGAGAQSISGSSTSTEEYRCELGMGATRDTPMPGAAPAVVPEPPPPPAPPRVPCGNHWCEPNMHCRHIHGQGAPSPHGGSQDHEYQCAPGAGGMEEVPRPSPPPHAR